MILKYIVASLNGAERAFAFPADIDHDRMWEAIKTVQVGRGDSAELSYRDAEPVAAGFVENGLCHGKSVSLKLSSRPEIDPALLQLAGVADPALASPEP